METWKMGRHLTLQVRKIARFHDEDAGLEPRGLDGGRDASEAPSRDDHVVIPPADVLNAFGLRSAIEGREARQQRQKEECRKDSRRTTLHCSRDAQGTQKKTSCHEGWKTEHFSACYCSIRYSPLRHTRIVPAAYREKEKRCPLAIQ